MSGDCFEALHEAVRLIAEPANDLFSRDQFSVFVGHHGAWDIYASEADVCVALPVDPASGHKASMFGTLGQARRILARSNQNEG